MNVIYAPELKQLSEVMPLLELASARLEIAVTPRYANTVTAEWGKVPDFRDRPHFRLTIADEYGSVYSDFSMEELDNSLHMRFRMPRIWGDLLQIRINIQHAHVESLIGELTP